MIDYDYMESVAEEENPCCEVCQNEEDEMGFYIVEEEFHYYCQNAFCRKLTERRYKSIYTDHGFCFKTE
jgi:hypothetical protein